MMRTRRSPYEVVINPSIRLQVRKRTAVTVVHAPDSRSAVEKLLQLMEEDDSGEA